ncbi:MAG: DUF3899 domain-containing protein [Candidatus Enteromonas sp.]|nr:DUF3899 domain-containing protein [Candidatus Enteromonas sp.]
MKPKTVAILRHSVISVGISAILFCLVYFLRGLYTLAGLSDALLLPGAVCLGIAGLALVGRRGTFDVLGYGVKRLIEQFTHNKDTHYENAGDYSLQLREKRQNKPFPYWVYLVMGGLQLASAIVLACLA